MPQQFRLPQLLLATLIILISSCSPVSPLLTSTNPPIEKSKTPISTHSPTPNLVITEPPYNTPTPDPNAFTINSEIDQEYSQEELARILFSKWMDHYMGENISPEMRLSEYKINSVIIPDNQICASRLGALFITKAEITAKAMLPLLPTTADNTSHWMTSGGGVVSLSATQITRVFDAAVFKSGNVYTLQVITSTPMCD